MTFREAYLKVLADNKTTQEEAARISGIATRAESWRLSTGDVKLSAMYKLLSPFGFHVQITNGNTTYLVTPNEKRDAGKKPGNPAFQNQKK